MLLLAWPIVLFLLVVFRFLQRFNAEFDRQQRIYLAGGAGGLFDGEARVNEGAPWR